MTESLRYLKPCPFCGSIDFLLGKYQALDGELPEHRHEENDCFLAGVAFVNPDDWNMRFQYDADTDLIRRLLEAVEGHSWDGALILESRARVGESGK